MSGYSRALKQFLPDRPRVGNSLSRPRRRRAQAFETTHLGYIDGDATLMEMSPPGGFITDKDELARLWKRWLLDEKAPAVDFGKYLVVVAVSKDGPIKSVTQRDEKKNGEMTIHITLDRKAKADGFHCMFAVFPRAGIKSIEGKEVKGK